MQAVVRIGAQQVQECEIRSGWQRGFHVAVPGDGDHLEVPVALVPVVEAAEGAGPDGAGADEDPVEWQQLVQAQFRIPGPQQGCAVEEDGGVDAGALPLSENVRERQERVVRVLRGECGGVGPQR